MDDLISRQAAIDAMETWDKFGCDPDGKLVRYDDDKHYIPYVHYEDMVHAIKHLPSAQPDVPDTYVGDMISRQAAIDVVDAVWSVTGDKNVAKVWDQIKDLPSAQPDADKYEYHYDHTDCIWYRPEARNRCPVTCAQYRDGWNDAMNYIFRDGQGYRPYRRDERYER